MVVRRCITHIQKNIFIHKPFHYDQNVKQGQLLAESNKFQFRVFLFLDWFQYQG